jgi:ornithine cyclodeaminase/alanine dehydrogenase-like protein (mu-crystallin family)
VPTFLSDGHCVNILKDHEVAEHLDIPKLAAALEQAFKTDRHSFTIPPRMFLTPGTHTLLIMPCCGHGLLGLKVVTMATEPGRGAHIVKTNYSLYDAQSGEVILLTEADSLTDLRTAATSVVATRLLARPDARVLGIFGTGRQARAHLSAMFQARDFEQVLICGSTPQRTRTFVELLSTDLPCPIRATDANTCAAEADVICTCTTSTVPLFDGRVLRPGTHLNLVGAFRSDTREVDDETARRSRIVVDTYEGCLQEAGDILIPQSNGTIGAEHVIADLHEALAEKRQVRRRPKDITLFKSVGCALEDLVAARLLST